MKVILTGATSFTGMWFTKALSEKNYKVSTFIQRGEEAYECDPLRKKRLEIVKKYSTPHFSLPFGSEAFLAAIEKEDSIDYFCHHAADVTNYKSPDFDAAGALEKNTRALPAILKALKKKGCRSLILTGSVFEQNEGKGSDNLRAVSPYGLSKGLTSDYFSYYCARENIPLKKFTIPNPFGPYEEVRFTTFLAKTWLEEKNAPVTMPDYVRDNIPVELLAKAYAEFISSDELKLNPSGFVESQGSFTTRFQKEIKKRFNKNCAFEIKIQTDFNEPLVRHNFHSLDNEKLGFSETKFWDDLANFYQVTYG